jgi:ferredoxin
MMSKSNNQSQYRLEVIRDKCISAASCVALAPGTFQLDQDEIAKVIDEAGDDAQVQLMAAQSCPAGAIQVIEVKTGKKIWPAKD